MRTDAETAGALWATDTTQHGDFHDYSDLFTEAQIEAESRLGETEWGISIQGEAQEFVAGAMSVRTKCCEWKGFRRVV